MSAVKTRDQVLREVLAMFAQELETVERHEELDVFKAFEEDVCELVEEARVRVEDGGHELWRAGHPKAFPHMRLCDGCKKDSRCNWCGETLSLPSCVNGRCSDCCKVRCQGGRSHGRPRGPADG